MTLRSDIVLWAYDEFCHELPVNYGKLMFRSPKSFKRDWGRKTLANDELQAMLDFGRGYDDGQDGEMLRQMYSAYRVDLETPSTRDVAIKERARLAFVCTIVIAGIALAFFL